jgi:hypothetical protein
MRMMKIPVAFYDVRSSGRWTKTGRWRAMTVSSFGIVGGKWLIFVQREMGGRNRDWERKVPSKGEKCIG